MGVLAASTIGNVLPLSVDNEILTFATLSGAMFVLVTFQITVCDVPPAQVTPVFGVVTLKGPAVLMTVTVMSVN